MCEAAEVLFEYTLDRYVVECKSDEVVLRRWYAPVTIDVPTFACLAWIVCAWGHRYANLCVCGLVAVDVWLLKVWDLLFDSLSACHKTSDGTAVRCLADVERQQLRIVKDCKHSSAAVRCVCRGGTVASKLM